MRTPPEYHASRRWLCCRLLLPLLASVAHAQPLHLGAHPGETFTFKFSVGSIESGRARMSVGFPVEKNGHRLVAVHAQAETLPWLALVLRLKDDYQLVLDADTLLPSQVVSVEEGSRRRRIETRFEGRAADLSITAPRGSGRVRRQLPDGTHDPLAALFAVRAAPLANGDQLSFVILDGTNLWRTGLRVRREPLRLERDPHSRPAIRLDGENQRLDDRSHPVAQPPRHFTAWLSDDRDRVLLRMEADSDLGHAELELTSYRR